MKTWKRLWKNIFNYSGTAGRREFYKSILSNIVAMYC